MFAECLPFAGYFIGIGDPVMSKADMVLGLTKLEGFLDGASDKKSTCQCRSCRRHGFDPWVRNIPWSRKWQPTPVFLPGKFHRQRNLARLQSMGLEGVGHDQHAHRNG